MRNLKKLIAPAVGGFVLSFFISLIATKGNFGVALLRGLLFAVIFAGLFFVIDFLFTRFLDGTSSAAGTPKSEPGLGANVDITLADEELADDGDDLKFFVGQNKMGLKAGKPDSDNNLDESVQYTVDSSTDVSTPSAPSRPERTESSRPVAGFDSKTSAGVSGSEAASFKPVPLGTPEPKMDSAPAAGDSEKIKDLDSLPEISDFDSDLGSDEDSNSQQNSGDDGYIDDTDFSGSNSSLYSRKNPGGDVTSGHDAETLAKAIQTILKKDE
ncbi:MAG: hypothetical protein IKP60_07400 [Treponema sp.]|nr:hypothetical protein [Treponema sp.]